MQRGLGTLTLGLALGAGMLLPVALTSPPAAAAVPSDPNPPIEQSCGLDLTLTLDASGSVSSAQAVDDVRNAGDAILTALKDTNSTARVTQFASLSEVLAQRAQVDGTSMSDGGALSEALQDYYNPQPQRPGNVNIYSYRGSGNPQTASSFSLSNNQIQQTNWDQGLEQAGAERAELLVFITDGDPTGYDFNQPGDPFRPQDVAVATSTGPAAQLTIDRAVGEANTIKSGDTRVLAVGVGAALNSSASRNRLVQIAGPQVVRNADLGKVDDLNDIDVALVTDFDDLAQFMRSLVLELCSPSLTVRKLAQRAGDPTYQPEQGRDITVTPTVPGGNGFDWILPQGATGASSTQATDANGFAQFQWEPDPPEESSAARVVEATDPNHTPGRPGADNDYRCELRNEAGDVRVVADDFADPANPSFELDPIEQEIVTCTIWNSFNYAPDIELTKVNAPAQVRGDLDPPATVTSTYTVTNPGNTPLADVAITDDRCGPVEGVQSGGSNVGDTVVRNGVLDPGEAWQFTCTDSVLAPRSDDPTGTTFVNTAEVAGLDPQGTRVTDTATDDVVAYTPYITLDKTVNGSAADTISAGDTASYSYDVTNDGDTPLGSVDLVDDTPPCTAPTLSDDGDGDAILAVGESWTYTCDATPDTSVINVATVAAVPLNPVTDAPFPAPNPAVTAEDTASVTVVNADLDLTKTADPEVVVLDPGPDPSPEEVTYTFEVDNPGSSPLARPDGTSTTEPGWVTDSECDSPAEYQSGDDDDDELLDPGETWTFACTNSVAEPRVNVAQITGQPTEEDGTPLPVDTVTDRAAAFVDVVQPEIEVTKTALVPVVLDPDAPASSGPDTPAPRPAEYRYEIGNPGNVALSLAGTPPADDRCEPLVLEEGDANSNDLLDPAEVWVYSCSTTLERQDATTPPGALPADVDNTVDVVGVPSVNGTLRPDKQVTGSADAEVTVIEPSLRLTKTASAAVVRSGSDVTYTVRVANTGTSGLHVTDLDDDKCALVYEGGDTDGDEILDGADTTPETWRFTCTRPVRVSTSGATDTNVATVDASDELGNTYTSTDDAVVVGVTAAIELTKVPDAELVPAGTAVTYTFEARNTGTADIPAADALNDVRLIDRARPPLASVCSSPALVGKQGGNQDDVLERDPAEVWVYQCSSSIVRATTNVGIVTAIGGRQAGQEFRVGDFAVARVEPFHPGIHVEKTASPTRLSAPGDVRYTYRVTNTGDVPLAGVAASITDDTCSPVRYVSGDLDGDGLLDSPDSIFEDAADETWVLRCTTGLDRDTTNVVVVSGSPTDQAGQPLCGPDAGRGRIPPCDATDRDRAHVDVASGPDVAPDPAPGPGQGPAAGPGDADLGDTGAPAGLWQLLALGLLLLGAGGTLLATARRTRATA